MALVKRPDLGTETVTQLGGINAKTGKPNPKSVEGYYLGFKATDSDFGPGKLHIFQTAQGNVGVWGKTNSNRQLTSDLVGNMVKLVFTGMGKASKGRKPPYNYEVYEDKSDTIEVAPAAASTFGDNQESNDDTSADEVDYSQDESEDSDVTTEEEALDVAPPARPTMPRRVASTPSAASIASVKARLMGNKSA